MNARKPWTRDDLIIAMNLYCKLSFGQLHHKTPIIVEVSDKLGRTPSSLAMKLSNLASLDPVQQMRGIKGLSGASKADREIWEEFSANWEKLGTESEARFQELVGFEFFSVDKLPIQQGDRSSKLFSAKELSTHEMNSTESLVMIKARVGQKFFRQMVLSSYGSRCCITGNPISELLIASHIIPWHRESKHRLDPHNGLCLSRTHDAAFDQGLIAFDIENRLIISRYLRQFLPEKTLEQNFIKYEGSQLSSPNKFYPDSDFIRFHREEIFLGA